MNICIKNIFEYIDNKELLEFKLFFYSKSFQKKLSIKIINYKEKYLEKIDISQYLYRTIWKRLFKSQI